MGTWLPPGLSLASVQLSCDDRANGMMKAIAIIAGPPSELLCGLREGMPRQWGLLLFSFTSSHLSADAFSNVASGDLQGRDAWQPCSVYS